MKRSPIIIVLVFLLCLTVIPASAVETAVTIQSVKATIGEIVYLPVSLEGTKEADTVGIALTFDRSALEFVASKSTWSIAGTIRNFDRQREYALWADSKAKSLSGELCRLAFRVREGAKASQCGVACNVVLKIDDQEVATYAAAGEITLKCRHSYGEWTPMDASAHSRICQLCGSEEYGSHAWDEGTVTKEPTQTQQGTRLLTCQLCGAEQEERIPKLGSPEETKPAEPSPTLPELSPTLPESERPQPSQTGGQGDPSSSGSTITVPVQPADGDAQGSETLVIPREDVVVIQPNGTPEEPNESDQAADASDTSETEGETQPAEGTNKPVRIGAVIIVCLLILASGIGYRKVGKKKK